jgi:hypothetical protein
VLAIRAPLGIKRTRELLSGLTTLRELSGPHLFLCPDTVLTVMTALRTLNVSCSAPDCGRLLVELPVLLDAAFFLYGPHTIIRGDGFGWSADRNAALNLVTLRILTDPRLHTRSDESDALYAALSKLRAPRLSALEIQGLNGRIADKDLTALSAFSTLERLQLRGLIDTHARMPVLPKLRTLSVILPEEAVIQGMVGPPVSSLVSLYPTLASLCTAYGGPPSGPDMTATRARLGFLLTSHCPRGRHHCCPTCDRRG